MSVVQGPDGDEITFNGQRGMYNNVSLDGGDYNNGFFGEQLGGQRAAIDITLEAVKEFQVVASGANAEFGRTAGGVVNVITKSGTNDLHGSLFHFQRLEGLTADASDGTPPTDFHREQFGGTAGGPIKRDRVFFFGAIEHINENLQRANLSQPLGTCACEAPVITNPAHEALINGSVECQRRALLNFFRTSRNQEEGNPIDHTIDNTAILGKLDVGLNPSNTLQRVLQLRPLEEHQPDLRCGDLRQFRQWHRGPVQDQRRQLQSLHDAFADQAQRVPRDLRAGTAAPQRRRVQRSRRHRHGGSRVSLRQSLLPAAQRRRIALAHADQEQPVDRVGTPHLQGREASGSTRSTIRSSVASSPAATCSAPSSGFLRYASPAGPGGFGPNAVACSNGSWVTHPTPCPAGSTLAGTPLLLFLQETGTGFPNVDPPGKSMLANEDLALFAQDQWQIRPNVTLNYGLRWDAQLMAETVDPATTAYAQFVNDPAFLSDGTIPDQSQQFQPRVGVAWDVKSNSKTVVRANFGLYYARTNMLSQAGSVTANGLQNQGAVRGLVTGLVPGVLPMPTWPGLVELPPLPAGPVPAVHGRAYHGVRLPESANHNRTSPSSRSWRRTGRCMSTSRGRRAST